MVPVLINLNGFAFQVACGWIHTTILIKSSAETKRSIHSWVIPLGYFAPVPNDILHLIFQLLTPRDLCHLAQVNSTFKSLSENDRLWKNHVIRLSFYHFKYDIEKRIL
jgi:hypothetical protein